jgi:DNA-binding transcriptional ArsR family regulator
MGTRWLSPLRATMSSDSLSEETLFTVLRNKRRRYALHYLKQREAVVSVGDLAEQIAAWETETPVAEITPDDRKRVYISLLQSHLPTLEEAGMVEFDEEDSTVRLTHAAKTVDIYVEFVPEQDIQWTTYYLGVAALAGVFLAAAWVGVYPFTELSPTVWFGFVVALFVVSSTAHHLYQRQNRLGNAGTPPE